MNSGARRLAMRSSAGRSGRPRRRCCGTWRTGPCPRGRRRASGRPGVAGHVRLPGALRRRAGQAADVGDQLADLVVLERIAQLLHGGPGHAVLDRCGRCLVGAAVNPAVVGQVGPLPPRPVPPWQPLHKAAEQRLAFRQTVGSGSAGDGCRLRRPSAAASVGPLQLAAELPSRSRGKPRSVSGHRRCASGRRRRPAGPSGRARPRPGRSRP